MIPESVCPPREPIRPTAELAPHPLTGLTRRPLSPHEVPSPRLVRTFLSGLRGRGDVLGERGGGGRAGMEFFKGAWDHFFSEDHIF